MSQEKERWEWSQNDSLSTICTITISEREKQKYFKNTTQQQIMMFYIELFIGLRGV